MFVARKSGLFKEILGHFKQCLWQPSPFIFHQKADLLLPCLWWPQDVFLGRIYHNHPNQVNVVPKPNQIQSTELRTAWTYLWYLWECFETTLRYLKHMQHKRDSMPVCAYYMYAFSSRMWIFARNNKLLICWSDELNYPPPSAEMCSILHSVPDLWNWDDFLNFFFAMSWQLYLCSSFPSSPPHSTAHSGTIFCLKSNTFHSSLHFILTLPRCQKVPHAAANGQRVCTNLSERLKVCVYVISPRMPRGITVQSVPCAW